MSKNILIVDDSSMMRLAVSTALIEAGYDVVEAVDGLDGLSKLQGAAKINLIVCDVNMPNMDGLTFVKTYKAIPHLQYIPVLMLTTEESSQMKDEGRAAGVRAWMVKPFIKETLINAVSKLVTP
jgi:two-component system chemotaxis response regulator CheY